MTASSSLLLLLQVVVLAVDDLALTTDEPATVVAVARDFLVALRTGDILHTVSVTQGRAPVPLLGQGLFVFLGSGYLLLRFAVHDHALDGLLLLSLLALDVGLGSLQLALQDRVGLEQTGDLLRHVFDDLIGIRLEHRHPLVLVLVRRLASVVPKWASAQVPRCVTARQPLQEHTAPHSNSR